jgi:hypothetical protein
VNITHLSLQRIATEPSPARVAVGIKVRYSVSQCLDWEDRLNFSPSGSGSADCLDVVNVTRPEKGLCEHTQPGVSTPWKHFEALIDVLYSVMMEVLRYTDVLF